MRTQENIQASLPRSATDPTTPDNGEAAQTAQRPQHTRRVSSISFAAPPIDRSFETSPADAVPTLEVASISAVSRNFTALGKDYLDARPSQREAAFNRLSKAGARMFADYVAREANTHPKTNWTSRGFRALNNAFKHDVANRGSVLGELTALRPKLAGFEAFIESANDRRDVIASDVKQFVDRTFGPDALRRTPQLEGVALGCMLQGAEISLAEASQDAAELAAFGPALVAFGNALERTFGPRLAPSLREGVDALSFWKSALAEKPEAILKRYETVVLHGRGGDEDFTETLQAARAAAASEPSKA